MKTGGDKCLICESINLQRLLIYYSRYNPYFFHSTAICQKCGHIQLYPLFNQDKYAEINYKFFRKIYGIDDQPNLRKIKKTKRLDDKLSPYLQNEFNVLDVGAGSALIMDYIQKKRCNYFAIEPVDFLSSSIQERGGIVIGKSIYDDYSNYKGFFDIIIFNGVLEHLLNPKFALIVSKYMMNSNALFFISVPNAAYPHSFKKGFRTSFIRPVHISYFCEGNLMHLAHLAGLKPVYLKSQGLINCLLKHGFDNYFQHKNYYTKQKRVFLKNSKQTFVKDYIKIMKDLPRALVKTLLE